VKGALDEDRVIQYHNYDFDFSGPALDELASTHPHDYCMYLASRTHLMQQPGFVMHQRLIRPCKPAKLFAQILTTADNLVLAKEKDSRKNQKTTKKKLTALATIGKDLEKVIPVDGVDLVAPAGRAERNMFCEFCKRTLTRACKLALCKKQAAGETVPHRKVTKRKRPKDEWTSKDDGAESVEDACSECEYDSFVEMMATGTSYRTMARGPTRSTCFGTIFQRYLNDRRTEPCTPTSKMYRLLRVRLDRECP
jgi:hypothetical protein